MMVRNIPHQKIKVSIRNKGSDAICTSINHQLNNRKMLMLPATIKMASPIFLIVSEATLSLDCHRLDLFFLFIN